MSVSSELGTKKVLNNVKVGLASSPASVKTRREEELDVTVALAEQRGGGAAAQWAAASLPSSL